MARLAEDLGNQYAAYPPVKHFGGEAVTSPGGYIRLHRKLLQNPIFTRLAPADRNVAGYFILRGGDKPVEWDEGGQVLRVPAGSLVTSYRSKADAGEISTQQTRDAIPPLSRKHLD